MYTIVLSFSNRGSDPPAKTEAATPYNSIYGFWARCKEGGVPSCLGGDLKLLIEKSPSWMSGGGVRTGAVPGLLQRLAVRPGAGAGR
jgi:hypothetical protein